MFSLLGIWDYWESFTMEGCNNDNDSVVAQQEMQLPEQEIQLHSSIFKSYQRIRNKTNK